ncbi:hypothetical protein ACLESD_46640 [Pyxidicoccus sp. 3LFB2]
MADSRYVYFFFRTDHVNIMEGFTTKLEVMGALRSDPNKQENVTGLMDFTIKMSEKGELKPSHIEIVDQTSTYVEVKGTGPGALPASLIAKPRKDKVEELPKMKATAKLFVDESDLLIYAPDGNVYWLKTEEWMKATKYPVTAKELEVLRPLLENEAVVANIPHTAGQAPQGRPNHAGGSSPKGEAGPPAEPVTCFLLNLNSILLSYSPHKGLAPRQQDASPFVNPPKSAPSGRKP